MSLIVNVWAVKRGLCQAGVIRFQGAFRLCITDESLGWICVRVIC